MNRTMKRSGRFGAPGRKAGLTRALAILGLFAGLAVSGLIYFVISRIKTESAEELRVRAQREGLPLSWADAQRLGVLPSENAAHRDFIAFFEASPSDVELRRIGDSIGVEVALFPTRYKESLPRVRREISESLLAASRPWIPAFKLGRATMRHRSWLPPLSWHQDAKPTLKVVVVAEWLSAVGLASAELGKWDQALLAFEAVFNFEGHMSSWPSFFGVMPGEVVGRIGIEALDPLAGAKGTARLKRLIPALSSPWPRGEPKSYGVVRLVSIYDWEFLDARNPARRKRGGDAERAFLQAALEIHAKTRGKSVSFADLARQFRSRAERVDRVLGRTEAPEGDIEGPFSDAAFEFEHLQRHLDEIAIPSRLKTLEWLVRL